MDPEARKRLVWVNLYHATNDAGLICRKCGISRPTRRKWLQRYQESGVYGLESNSRRPRHMPNIKIGEEQEAWILDLRKQRKLGARRMQHELERQYNFHLSLATIHKVLKKHKLTIIMILPKNGFEIGSINMIKRLPDLRVCDHHYRPNASVIA